MSSNLTSSTKGFIMKIVDVDYLENDAVLELSDGRRLYFQWDGKNAPTFYDALEFIVNNYDLVDKYDSNG